MGFSHHKADIAMNIFDMKHLLLTLGIMYLQVPLKGEFKENIQKSRKCPHLYLHTSFPFVWAFVQYFI